eukprot:TRINITY_DN7058_c0_g1_i2.p1 TRINITY_DN7058_c0_g1~~TRINITY_DN7058_c0_g1_i2.p1  ORF type:complete len:172 (-),score=42.38 TRINITY_DN7058_c0_g1_i2:55-570(-)
MAHLSVDSTNEEIRKNLTYLTNAQIDECKKNFKKFDLDKDGALNLFEIKQLLEAIGQSKTHLETVKWIKTIDTTGSGNINFNDFMKACFPSGNQEPIILVGRINKSTLAKPATFFEEQFRKNKGPTKDELEDRVKKEALLRKEEREEKKKQKEKEESKARFAEKMKAFKNE